MRMLTLYYSWSGHTKQAAELIHDTVGGDIAAIETAAAYPGTYSQVASQGHDEVKRGFEPELRPLSVRPEDYDVLYLGSPVWWYTMTPAVRSFLSRFHGRGMTVCPFVTNEGGAGSALRDMSGKISGCRTAEGLNIRFSGSRMVTGAETIRKWALSCREE